MSAATIDECLGNLSAEGSRRQRAHLTFRGNVKQGRHGWLRLTPAYSLHVVKEILDRLTPNDFVLDPFSGTATTTLASVVHGVRAHSVDVNPFLVWLGNLKLRRFSPGFSDALRNAGEAVAARLCERESDRNGWVPKLHQIEKWWDHRTLDALSRLFHEISNYDADQPIVDLLKIAFCRVMIATSNASFGHQSMSFKKDKPAPTKQRVLFDDAADENPQDEVCRRFIDAVAEVAEGTEGDAPQADGLVLAGDSRHLDSVVTKGAYTTVITSPPYPNRMSYIRELRPYMYWLGYLTNGRQAGELDWQAIGGTWGCATSNLADWQPANGTVAFSQFDEIVAAISSQHRLLGNYVHRYFNDIKLHLHSLRKVVARGARCYYVVGNSKFYDTILPVEEIYAALFEDAGFRNVGWKAIRKRNSKKELFEYVVYAESP